jgi:ribosomal protein S6--L-glutamate ligase
MNIGIFMLERSQGQGPSIMPEVVQLLTGWGARVEAIYPERQLTDLAQVRVEHDLYILKTATDLVWSIAGALHAAGARILNPYPVAAQMRDKIIASRILQEAGIPVPETYVTSRAEHLAPLLNDGPLVVKPYRGSQGRGVRKVWDSDELDEVATNDGPVFAQRYHRPHGLDRKIYCIGGQLFGVERVWPARTYEEKLGRPFTIPPELHDIALRCGRAFGVDLFGVDVIESGGQWYVVDINSFPGFKGVPEAALRVADYIYTAGQAVLEAGPSVLPVKEAVS